MRPEDRSKDFYDTLSSYLASAMKGHPIVEYTMGEVTVHGQTEYTIHSLLGIESLLNERTLPQRIVDIANREAKMKKKRRGPSMEKRRARQHRVILASVERVGGAHRWSALVQRVHTKIDRSVRLPAMLSTPRDGETCPWPPPSPRRPTGSCAPTPWCPARWVERPTRGS